MAFTFQLPDSDAICVFVTLIPIWDKACSYLHRFGTKLHLTFFEWEICHYNPCETQHVEIYDRTYSILLLKHKADLGERHIKHAKFPSRRHSVLCSTSKCSHIPTSGTLHWQLHRPCARSERSSPQRWEILPLHDQRPYQHCNCPLHDRTLDLPMPSTPKMLQNQHQRKV